MDVEMPVIDGMTATQEIRGMGNSTAQKPWIIGLSANVWRETVERALAAGMNDYLSKPVRREEVGASIRNRSRPVG
jgi:CheY-like chemotaxis protein